MSTQHDERNQSRQAYVMACSQRFDRTLTTTHQTIERGDKQVQELQAQLSRRIREVSGARRKLTQMQASRADEMEKYGREFDRLIGVPKVKDVRVAPGVIQVFTDILYCVDPRTNRRHRIGIFRIDIFENCVNGGVRWTNLTNRHSNGHHAPHIDRHGVACFGNTAEIWPELIGNYEFAAAAMVAIQFVESVNTDDPWGMTISQWPVEEEPEPVKEPAKAQPNDRVTLGDLFGHLFPENQET